MESEERGGRLAWGVCSLGIGGRAGRGGGGRYGDGNGNGGTERLRPVFALSEKMEPLR